MAMKDRRGYESHDLKEAAKAVEKKGGKKAFEKDMMHERKDYAKDQSSYPSGKMGCGRKR